MTSFFGQLKGAADGWGDILAGKADWTRHFRFDRAGFVAAFIAYGLMAVLTFVVLTIRYGYQGPQALLSILLGFMLPLIAGLVAVQAVVALTRQRVELPTLFIPFVYMQGLILFIGALAQVAGFSIGGALVGVLAFMMLRLGRVGGGLPLFGAILFALGVIVLSLLPNFLPLLLSGGR